MSRCLTSAAEDLRARVERVGFQAAANLATPARATLSARICALLGTCAPLTPGEMAHAIPDKTPDHIRTVLYQLHGAGQVKRVEPSAAQRHQVRCRTHAYQLAGN